MAVLRRMANTQFRQPANKETEWSGICDNVFQQYPDDDDVFGLAQRQSSSSDNSAGLLEFSISSGQSNHTTGTSPDPAWVTEVAMMAHAVDNGYLHHHHHHQPQARESEVFWQKHLYDIEREAAQSERQLRTVKSHSGFLSLGGNPSPPSQVPSFTAEQSLSIPRSRPREAANGKKRSMSNLRSASRGRPQGVAKTITTTQNATIRKRSVSPTKMMTPSRYRAGFRDVWTDKLQGSPPKYALKMPTQSLPESPPPSAHLSQHDYAAFSSPTHPPSAMLAAYDAELSPLTATFQQQARIHTPDASPFFAQPTYIDNVAYQPSYTTQVPLNDTRDLATNRIGSFDFGFAAPTTTTADDAWTATAYSDYPAVTAQDVFGGVEQHDMNAYAGLGISCDQAMYYPPQVNDMLSTQVYHHIQAQHMQARHSAAYAPMPHAEVMPTTPHKPMQSRSPSPPMTEPRSRRPGASGGRRASKHRRTKSTTAVPRLTEKGGFVNFTPDDSNKILSGVAPSGSSKTKARREKEAADKRRRLSQAAVKAVVEAGGDLETLHAAGLIV